MSDWHDSELLKLQYIVDITCMHDGSRFPKNSGKLHWALLSPLPCIIIPWSYPLMGKASDGYIDCLFVCFKLAVLNLLIWSMPMIKFSFVSLTCSNLKLLTQHNQEITE